MDAEDMSENFDNLIISETQPARRTGHVAALYKNCMLIWGGYKETTREGSEKYLPSSELWIYDPLTEKWFLKMCHGLPPPGTSGAIALIVSNVLYLFGGYCENGNTNQLYKLNLETLYWSQVEAEGDPPIAADKMSGWEYNEKLYFFGGFGVVPDIHVKRMPDFQFVLDYSTPWHYRRGWSNQFVVYDTEKNKWICPIYHGPVPSARAAHAAARVGSSVYVFGGRHENARQNDIHCLNLDTMMWSGKLQTHGREPKGRSWHSWTAVSKDTIVLYGGYSQEKEPLSDCWQFYIPTLTWRQVELSFEKPRLWHTACLNAYGEVLIYGGCTVNILDHTIAAEHAGDIIVLRFIPKSLLRLCMDIVISYSAVFQPFWSTLPCCLQRILNIRMSGIHHTSLGGS